VNIDFETLQEEMAAFEIMTEEEAVEFYKVDSKREAVRYIEDWWQTSYGLTGL
jgi:hypothetical protein